MQEIDTNVELLQQIKELEAELEQSRQEIETLRRSEFKYRNILEQMPHEIHIWDLVRDELGGIKTWKLVYANPAALSKWNLELASTVGLTTDEIFPGVNATEKFLPIVQHIFDTGEPFLWEEFFAGTDQTLQMVSFPVGEQFVSSGLDVTRQKLLEEELRQAHKMEAIGQLAGGIAHDFNNQLTPILGYADLLSARIENEQDLKAVERIRVSANRCADLTSHLLAFARKSNAEFVPVELNSLIEELIDLLEHSIDKSIEIESRFDGDDFCVNGDASLLQNAFLNIALNARDAMPGGGKLRFTTEAVRLDQAVLQKLNSTLKPGRYLKISIQDSGCVMPPEVAANVFEPYFTTKELGNGMGLASVYGTIQRHLGDITLESAEGKGSCFTIWLPICREGNQTDADVSDYSEAADEHIPLSILVVDDEIGLCQLHASVLANCGHEVKTASDPLDALTIYEQHWRRFDLVILDMNMPHMDGIELLRLMKKINPKVKVVVCSGYNVGSQKGEVLSESFAVLQKPFQPTDLITLVNQVCSSPAVGKMAQH